MTTETPDFFVKIESLRKHMLLNVSQFTELLGVSRMSYYGWLKGKAIRKSNEDKVKKVVKNLLVVMKDHNWPTSSDIALEPDERLARLKELLSDS